MSKNNVDLLPLRAHSEETLRGHLMLSFLASLAHLFLNDKLKAARLNAGNAILVYRNLKCQVYGHEILVKEPVKSMNDIAKALGLTIPAKLVEGKYPGN
ncbi:MAG: hypothetical protein FWF31_06725 [Desulfobulbus sp.]|nr:hypothetical protein [Desulfobulbus sp.]